MGKEAREARRANERLAGQHPAALAAATMADELFARRWRGAEDDYSLVLGQVRRRQTSVRLHVEEIHGYVSQLRSSGYDWPAATYLPMSLLGRRARAQPVPGHRTTRTVRRRLAAAGRAVRHVPGA